MVRRGTRRSFVTLAACLLLIPMPTADAATRPTVKGPIGTAGVWGHALWDSWFELTGLGYQEDEYFISGIARTAAGETAPYTTRVIVNRPAKASRFNGTVLLDWVNVTAQFENAVDIVSAHEMLIREGFAFVHASVQSAGICCTPLTPKVWDPVRYQELTHPGDDYASDIFTQIARAIRAPEGADPMKGLRVRRILAAGQSQSAIRLYGYVNGVQRRDRAIDGFLIHGGGGKSYGAPPSVPVLHLLSDAEASTESPNTQRNYRLWEIAGSSHSDFWIGYHQEFGQGPRSVLHRPKEPASADRDMHEVAGNYGEQIHPMDATCILAGSTFPMRYSVSAAIHHLDGWVRRGTPPPPGPRFTFDADVLARDANGNALGGIRLPPIVVPVATYVSTACGLGGVTVPFSDAQLEQMYRTHAEYFARMKKATAASVGAGFLLRPDANDLLARACEARVRWGSAGSAACAT